MNLARIGLVPWDDLFVLRAAPSSLTQVLQQIQIMIVTGGFYKTSQAFVTLDPDPWPALPGPFVSIHPGRHTLIAGQWGGAGPSLAGYRGSLGIRIADQCMLDEVGRDDAALLRTDAGLVDRAQQLAEFLTGEAVSTALLKTGLVQTPLTPGVLSDPEPRRGDRRWRKVRLGMEFDWTHVYVKGAA